MSLGQYRFKVVGEGKARAKGVLGFVLPQALELVSRSAYVATLEEANPVPTGTLRIWRDGEQIKVQFNPNPNAPGVVSTPAWTDPIINMSRELGRNVTWEQPQPTR